MRAPLSSVIAAGIALSATAAAVANDFPTQARVEYVLRCMDANGGQNYNTLYACVCAIDKIAESFSYAEFSEAETFALSVEAAVQACLRETSHNASISVVVRRDAGPLEFLIDGRTVAVEP